MELAQALEHLHNLGASRLSSTDNPDTAVERLIELYSEQVEYAVAGLRSLGTGGDPSRIGQTFAFYPILGIPIGTVKPAKMRSFHVLAYGFCRNGGGFYCSSITDPTLFRDYLVEQIELVRKNHESGPIVTGLGTVRMPIQYLMDRISGDGFDLDEDRIQELFHNPSVFELNESFKPLTGTFPLAQFEAPLVDYSLLRLAHYTGTSAKHFQRFILLTNYPMYLQKFREMAEQMVRAGDGYTDVVASNALNGAVNYWELPQMPAIHLKREDGNGITMINIGVGPSNAKNLMDHISVLRPHAVLMVGHCGGLRPTQDLGQYVLCRGVFLDDGVMEQIIPPRMQIDSIGHLDQAIRSAVAEILQISRDKTKTVLENGTVVSTYDRNWEVRPDLVKRYTIESGGAAAVDMETATIIAAGKHHAVPCGGLLCISDVPVTGRIKLPGMAQKFYKDRKEQHLQIAVRVMEICRQDWDGLHSRKLRTITDPPFR